MTVKSDTNRTPNEAAATTTISRKLSLVWLLLVVLTVASAWVSGHHSAVGAAVGGVVILAVSFVKVRLVGSHFMELDTAPRLLRAAFDVFCVGAAVLLSVLFLLA